MYYRLLPPSYDYEEVVDAFEWFIPDRYNVANHVERHADAGDPTALRYETAAGDVRRYRYSDLRRRSSRLANALSERGIGRGDAVAVSLPQHPAVPVVHLAAYKLGAVVVPLSTLFGPNAYEYRLRDSESRVLVTDASNLEDVAAVRDDLPDLERVWTVEGDGDGGGDAPFESVLESGAPEFDPVETAADDPAAIFYTSGTTGDPKGVVQAHRHVIGNLPGLECWNNRPGKGERIWSPADWAWAGGYLALLVPPMCKGMTVVGHAGRFDPAGTMGFLERHEIRHSFLPPTALKRIIDVAGSTEYDLRLRSIMSGGESLPPEVFDWWREHYDVVVNEMYGQTEADSLTSNCSLNYPVEPGSVGRPVPGRTLGIVDEDGEELPPGELGEIAVERPDPVIMLGYHGDPERTEEALSGEWFHTGDMGRRDEEGYIYFVSRKDDLIISSGYRISPIEVEDTLIEHPDVAECAVIGVPDETRGEVVKAFVRPRSGVEPTGDLIEGVQRFVKDRLAKHEYPREVEFVEELPTTTTGKVKRSELGP